MTTQEIETINKLKQQFSDNFLGNSNEVEFTNFLNNLVSKGILTQGTAYNYHATKPKNFFKEYFGIDIFRVQKNGIEFLESCLKEMKDGNLARINRNREKGIDIPKFDGTPSASLKYYIEFLQQKGTDSKENEPTTEEDSDQNEGDTMDNKTKTPPLNQILYGPPGTGKTYSTIDRALEILRHYELIDEIPESREAKRVIFDEYRANKQIEFVTFHQNFSYEEFVEGIKPKFVKKSKNPSNETETKSKEMVYKIKSGIFKKICKKALKYCDSSNKITLQEIQERIKSNPCVWKVSLGEKTSGEALLVQEYCFKHDEIRIAHLDKGDGDRVVKPFKYTMQKGDFVGVFSEKSILKAIGIIVGDYEEKEVIGGSFQKIAPFKRTRKVKWLLKNEDIDSGKNLSNPQDAVFDSGIKAKDLFEKIQDRVGYTFDDLPNQITCKEPYILIIDEINRGNISKILGELITLIEPSKRIGASDEEKARGIGNESLEATLPYSNDSFGVPSNLYIIGTMNTADRSIALLDTALCRRFEFVEMMPDEECIKNMWLVENDEDYENSSIDEWNAKEAKVLYEILTAINNRIEFLLDREHTIGHAFFFEKAIKEDGYFVLSLDSLKEIFAKKIIPLLQEYFYDDYAKIDAVLNGNGMIKPFSKQDLKVNLNDDFVDSDKKVYRITDSNMWKKENFQRIYDSSIKIDENE